MAKTQTIGKNVVVEVKGSILTLTIDMSKDFGPSASGKTIIVASTEGNKTIEGLKVGLNAYKYPDTKKVSKKTKK